MAFLPLYGMTVGLHPGKIGLLFGIQGISSILAKPVMGRISDQFGRRPLIIAGQIICASTVIYLPWVEAFWLLLSLAFVFGFGEAVIGTSTSALVADLCQARSFGSAMGVFGTIKDMGHASGPILSGFLVSFLGYRSGFGIVGGLLVIMTVIFLFAIKGPLSETNPKSVTS